ncbi:MAG TPA: helix-turn-helix domain-containing protein [Candidatus Paceibacterota bacterium]|jgi:excisionase family DNA binding protein|nr:helix-turn-helix domain-containing protein [Candidatus Paceibacterota bacterium]
MENKNKKAIYISVAELAKMLGISRIAVFNKIKKGQIPAEKIGRSYAISMEHVNEIVSGSNSSVLTEDKKSEIKKAVEKVVKEYGETLKLLGKE